VQAPGILAPVMRADGGEGAHAAQPSETAVPEADTISMLLMTS
jgi:hypothetical protein